MGWGVGLGSGAGCAGYVVTSNDLRSYLLYTYSFIVTTSPLIHVMLRYCLASDWSRAHKESHGTVPVSELGAFAFLAHISGQHQAI